MCNFKEFKTNFVDRCKSKKPCTVEYKKVLAATDFKELFEIIKNNFNWCYRNDVINIKMIMNVRNDARINNIFVNEDVKDGYLLVDNSTVEALGNSS